MLKNKYHRLLLFVATLPVTSSFGMLQDSKPTTKNASQEIEIVADLRRPSEYNESASAEVLTGPVHAGERVQFLGRLVNNSGKALRFDRLLTGCDCVRVACTERSIAEGEAIDIEIDFQAPKSSSTGRFAIQMSFWDADAVTVHLDVRGELKGVLYLPPTLSLESDGDISMWEVPIVLTPPLEASQLEIRMPEELSNIVPSLEIRDGQPWACFSAAEKLLGIAGAGGVVVVHDRKTGIESSSRITFLRRQVVKFSPGIIRFRRVEGSHVEFEASAIVQATGEQPLLEAPREKSATDQPTPVRKKNIVQSISCEADDADIAVHSQRINDSLYRLRLVSARPERDGKPLGETPVRWTIVTPVESVLIDTIALFPEE